MKAAIVTDFSQPPRYGEYPDPVARGKDELVVDVLAAGLSPRVRSQADGSHYTSNGELPLVPGIDAVVRDPKGKLRYALLDDTVLGTMAERTVIEQDRSVVLPGKVDPVAIAAAMNPAMSSWVALRRRVDFKRGQRVLILGATGSAGRMAIQVAKRFGAAQVLAAGRDAARLAELPALGADRALTFAELAEAADVDVVIDYVWGEPTAAAMVAIVTARADRSKPLTWIEIGSVAGPTAAIPSAALRSSRLQIVGSGIGSVPGHDFAKELPKLAEAVSAGAFDVHAKAVPLAQVATAWADRGARDRVVLVP
jgi:NADPH:quinone reductase-like Zn-dependent oxidoreductase